MKAIQIVLILLFFSGCQAQTPSISPHGMLMCKETCGEFGVKRFQNATGSCECGVATFNLPAELFR